MAEIQNVPTVVIVDALSTGSFIAPHLKKRGFQCLHVFSSDKMSEHLVEIFRPQDFIERLTFAGDLEAILAGLTKYDLKLVLAGSEPGVELADQLSRRLGLPSSDTSLSLARRNKYMMQENLRARGLRAIREKFSTKLDEIVAWAESQKAWPVVLKPVEDAGTEGVHFCNSVAEVTAAYNSIMHHINNLGIENRAVLAQEKISGEECVVNTVSFKGNHYITDHWKYRKIVAEHSFPIYDYARLVPHPTHDNRELARYDADVLDALGFTFGPAHAEIMLTATGPVLIEVGARLMGGALNPDYVTECIGHNQLDLTLDCFLDHQHFLKQAERPYKIIKHCMMKFLIAYQSGKVAALPGKAIIEKFSSVRQVKIAVKPGERLAKTVDLFTSPGEIILIHHDPEILEEDYRRICELEKQGLFEFSA